MALQDRESGKSSKNENLHKNHRKRLRKRILNTPVEDIEAHEFMEAILFSLFPRHNTNELAHRLIDHYKSVENVLQAPSEELTRLGFLAEEGAKQLAILHLIPHYIKIHRTDEIKYIHTSENAYEYLKPFLADEKVEKCYLLSLDRNFKLIGKDLLQTGDRSSVSLQCDKVVSLALKRGATNAILAHNHPHGNINPSESDLILSEQLIMALASVNIHLIEHCIITNSSYMALSKFRADGKELDFFKNAIENNRHLISASFLNENTALRQRFANRIAAPSAVKTNSNQKFYSNDVNQLLARLKNEKQ